MSTELFLRAKQVAALLDVHVATVYRLVNAGRIRSHRNGVGKVRPRGLRVPESAVTEFLQGSAVAPEEEIAS